jgi:hypothetical protein
LPVISGSGRQKRQEGRNPQKLETFASVAAKFLGATFSFGHSGGHAIDDRLSDIERRGRRGRWGVLDIVHPAELLEQEVVNH